MNAIKINSATESNWYKAIVGNVVNNVFFQNGKWCIQSVFTGYLVYRFENADVEICEPETGIMAGHNQYALMSKIFHH